MIPIASARSRSRALHERCARCARRYGFALLAAAALTACGGAPKSPPAGPGAAPDEAGGSASQRSGNAAEAAAARWRALRARAGFDPASAASIGAEDAARMSIDQVLAWSEARVASGAAPSPEVQAAFAARTEPLVRRALLLGYVQAGVAPAEAEIVAALESHEPALREAAVLVCARSSARGVPERVLGSEVFGADELAILATPETSSEPQWNRISGAWVEERFRAARRYGQIDGKPGRSVVEEELRADPAFLREVVLSAVEAKDRIALAPHFAAELGRGVAPELLARLLAECDAETLFPGRATLEPEWAGALRGALLSPACSDGTVAKLLDLKHRLPLTAPWRGALQFVGGEPAAGLALRRGFDALREEDALAALVVLGRVKRSEALALLSELAHPSREVGHYVFAARVACGDPAPLDLAFARALAGSTSERRFALNALLSTGAAQRQRPWFLAHREQLVPVESAQLAYAWGSRELPELIVLLGEDVEPAWSALAIERLLSDSAEVPPAIASSWPRGDARSYDRALGAVLARARAPRGLALLENALHVLETDGALLAAAVLFSRLGAERGAEMIRAALLTAPSPQEQARLGWIAGRLLGAAALAWMPDDAAAADPARDAVWLGAAAAASATAKRH